MSNFFLGKLLTFWESFISKLRFSHFLEKELLLVFMKNVFFFFYVKSIKNVLILRKKSSENKSLFFFLIYKRVCYGFYSSFKNPRFKFCHDKEKSFYKNRVQA